ncbi:hypothetical protein HK097_008088 [Rhizophlyctis rosea]|uniref:Uncharacterized protein n=1 Tax=Rhizophlyctis rosea TaxID=64517 RepID=A0AAD5X5H9_9FUNG|nr:hypothetical protein HK097_008088 [Rhizophlyctis rosea]
MTLHWSVQQCVENVERVASEEEWSKAGPMFAATVRSRMFMGAMKCFGSGMPGDALLELRRAVQVIEQVGTQFDPHLPHTTAASPPPSSAAPKSSK